MRILWRREFKGWCLLSTIGTCPWEGWRSTRCLGGCTRGQEEIAGGVPTPNSCRYFDTLENLLLNIHLSSCSLSFSPQIWVRKTSDSTKMRIYLGQLQRGLFVIRRRSAAWLSTVFFPWPFFWSVFLFCFFLNRKFLTWELLLGLGKWRTLLWILQGTFVANHFIFVSFFPASTSSSHRSPWDSYFWE